MGAVGPLVGLALFLAGIILHSQEIAPGDKVAITKMVVVGVLVIAGAVLVVDGMVRWKKAR